MSITTEHAAVWFESRAANTPMQGAREMYKIAAAALRAQQEAEKNEPLTLDELRQMDGEPVWIVESPDWGHWELSGEAVDYLEGRETDFYGMRHDDPAGRYGLHKLGWLAYRHEPVVHGEWIHGCTNGAGTEYCYCSECMEDALKDAAGYTEFSDFCPHCGAIMDGGTA